MTQLRLAALDDWWKATFSDRHELVKIAGDFRPGSEPRQATIDLVELGGSNADTVRILVPSSAPMPGSKQKPKTCQFPQKDDNGWRNGWASVLVSAALAAPIVDPVRLADLVHDPRRIRFCCDTNALAGGVISWLLVFLGPRADIFTSAVVDRELAAWPDRWGANFWSAATPEAWSMRTQYRLARRLIEAPPSGVVVDRLSPEQGALMLAKLRDEQRLAKSPDADVLLVELARSLVRDQPRNARVVFLTGDRNNARTATGALGAENVLYAAADSERVRPLCNTIVTRGAWRPDGALGAVHVPTVSSLLWALLAPCDRLLVQTDTQRWQITACASIPRGAPSDWADPWIEVRDLPVPTRAVSTRPAPPTPPDPPTVSRTPLVAEDPFLAPRAALLAIMQAPAQSFLRVLSAKAALESPPSAPPPLFEASSAAEGTIFASSRSVSSAPTVQVELEAPIGAADWLLPPVEVGSLLKLPPGIRPSPGMIFPLLAAVLGGPDVLNVRKHSDTTLGEARRILRALGAIDAEGGPGPRVSAFRVAWQKRDHDWFHMEMLRLPGYAAALAFVRANPSAPRNSRQESHISMARALGQVARLDRIGGALVVGDAPVRKSQLLSALDRWLARPGATLDTSELCRRAGAELSVTPARLEHAMELLWAGGSGVQFEGRTGGTVVPGFAERVITLGLIAPQFRLVAPGDLSFGRSGPVRFVTRVR